MKLRQARKIAAHTSGRGRYDHDLHEYWLHRWYYYEEKISEYRRRDHRITKAIRLLRRFRPEEYNHQCLYLLIGLKREKI